MLDAGQRCECDDDEHVVRLEAQARETIEQRLLVAPDIDVRDSTLRLLFSVALGPGAALAALALLATLMVGMGLAPPLIALSLGVPFALVTLAWVGVFVWSELEMRRPTYPGAGAPSRAETSVVTATIEEGAIDVAELRQDGDNPVVIRDAVAEDRLVLKLPGKRIEVPAGRLDVELPPGRLRLKHDGALAQSWEGLPEELRRAGRLHAARLGKGVRVELVDGELEDLGERESSFREAAEDLRRVKPSGGRVRLRVIG